MEHARDTRVRFLFAGLVCAVMLALWYASAAGAAAPGQWTEIEGSTLPSPIAQFGTVAGADGSLFVAFADPGGNVLVSHASADGSYISTVIAFPVPPIATTPAGYPTIVRAPDGKLRIVYSGERNGVQGVFSGEGSADGSTWSTATLASDYINGTAIESAVGGDGTVYFGQAAATVSLHRGLNAADAPQIFQPVGFSQEAGLAVDGGDGSVWLGWMTSPGLVLKVRHADPASGAPTGAEYVAPALAGGPVGTIYHSTLSQPLSISGLRSRPGIYTSYVDTADRSTLLLWRVGDPTPKVAAKSATGDIANSALAAAADGGLWVIWLDSTAGTQTVQYRELAPDGITLGPIGKLALPPSNVFMSVHQVTGIAQPGGVEIILGGSSDALRIYATLAPTPVAATTPPPPPPPPAPPAPPPIKIATSLSPKVKAGRNLVRVTLRAPTGATALGTIQLKAKLATTKKAMLKLVGKVSFKLAAGQTRTFTVALNKSGKSALARLRKLKVSVAIAARNAAGKTKTATRTVTLKATR